MSTTNDQLIDNKNDNLIDDDDEHPRKLIPKLCRQMYKLGWVTGTGGGMSIRMNNQEIYIAPSGVHSLCFKHNFFAVGKHLTLPSISMMNKCSGFRHSFCTPDGAI